MTKTYETKECSSTPETVSKEVKTVVENKETFLSQWDNWSSSDDFPTEFCAG